MTGQRVGHYEIGPKIGAGGMGVVYRAHDTRLERDVAIKFLPDDLARCRDALGRFEREARAASALNHPNVCTVYELGEFEGQPFLVMELLEGRTLRQRTAAGLLALGEALELAVQITGALEAVHGKGIIHRDIKPANIFITTGGRAKLMDFGIAKLATRLRGAEITTETLLTPAGMAVGTTAYMSPEQARGEEVDARTDVFSFGVVLYELATGMRPFGGETPAVIFEAILDKAPLPPLELRPELPPDLARIILKALEKDRSLRYQSSAELRSDLLRLARGVSQDTGAHRPLRRGPVARALRSRLVRPAIAMGIAGAAAVSVALWHRAQARPLTDRDWIVLADFVNNTGEALFDGALKQALSVQLNESPYLNVVADGRVEAALRRMGRPGQERLTAGVAREVCQREGAKAVMVGTIGAIGSHYSIGLDASACSTGDTLAQEQAEAADKDHVLAALGRATSRMRRRLGESLASVRKLDTPVVEATTPSLEALKAYSLGWEQHRRGSFAQAMAFYRRALELDPAFALAYRALGVMHNNAGEWELAEQYRAKAFEQRQRATERERLFIEADYYFGVHRDQEKAAEVYRVYTQMYPRDPVVFLNWGVVCSNLGQHERAAELYREAMRTGNSASPIYYSNLASACRRLNRFREARALLEEALAKFDRPVSHSALYLIARLEGDAATMAREVDWFRGKPEEHSILGAQAITAAVCGRFAASREFWRLAAAGARRAGMSETAASYLASQAVAQALVGYVPAAREAALDSLPHVYRNAGPALALALAGSATQALSAADDLAKRYPHDTLLNRAEIPPVRAAVEIARGNARGAIDVLEQAACEFSSAAPPVLYLRGQAHLRAGSREEAARAFQSIIDHPGIFTEIAYPLAWLGLARAHALAGKTAGALQAYQHFLELWKDADPGVPLLKQARQEYRNLSRR